MSEFGKERKSMEHSAGPVERVIRAKLSTGQVLNTHARGAEFEIGRIDTDGLVLLLGPGKAYTRFYWDCLEGIPGFLSGREWVKVGGSYMKEGEPETLDAYLKHHVYRQTANYVTRVLEAAGMVQVDLSRPLEIRLIAN